MKERKQLIAEAHAPGKVILMGEHAVVYAQPALAIPVFSVWAQVRAWALDRPGEGIWLEAPQIGLATTFWEHLAPQNPLRVAVQLVLEHYGSPKHNLLLEITSTIPVAAGLGSSAAVTVAVLRALSRALGGSPTLEILNAWAYEVEKLHHGTPSGVDNTTVTYARPVYFRRGHPPQPLQVGGTLHLLIANTGIPASTREMVARVRAGWEQYRDRFEGWFQEIGQLVEAAREALAHGDARTLGAAMNRNHELLRAMGVSHPRLEDLVRTARDAGAWGAKLSGGGGGGNMIALVPPEALATVQEQLRRAGARQLWVTRLAASGEERR